MVQLSVTAKGQITLKKEVLEHMNIKPGDKVNVELMPGGRVNLQHDLPKTRTLEDLYSAVNNQQGIQLTIEEMNEGIAKAWAGKRE